MPATSASNGLAFSPDNRTLYRSDTTSHTIRAYDFDVASGQLGASRILREFSQDRTNNYGGRPDGAAVDSEGAYWCAMMEGSRLLRLSPDGEILSELKLPARCPTMLAFGGPDLKTLYVTTARNNRPAAEECGVSAFGVFVDGGGGGCGVREKGLHCLMWQKTDDPR